MPTLPPCDGLPHWVMEGISPVLLLGGVFLAGSQLSNGFTRWGLEAHFPGARC